MRAAGNETAHSAAPASLPCELGEAGNRERPLPRAVPLGLQGFLVLQEGADLTMLLSQEESGARYSSLKA